MLCSVTEKNTYNNILDCIPCGKTIIIAVVDITEEISINWRIKDAFKVYNTSS